jgi:chemotaxis protein histidine kinase CheA
MSQNKSVLTKRKLIQTISKHPFEQLENHIVDFAELPKKRTKKAILDCASRLPKSRLEEFASKLEKTACLIASAVKEDAQEAFDNLVDFSDKVQERAENLYETWIEEVPSCEPICQAPVEPVEEDHSMEQPVEQEPVEQEPVEQEPVEQEPVEQEPVEQEPVEEQHAEPVEEEHLEEQGPVDPILSMSPIEE